MPKQEGQKSKLVTLLRILEQRTDENHRLNVPQLVQLLENQAFWPSARAFTATSTPAQSGLRHPAATGARRRVLDGQPRIRAFGAEAAGGCGTVQQRHLGAHQQAHHPQAGSLCSDYEGTQLQRQVYVDGRPKTDSQTLLYSIDALHTAINRGCLVQFRYKGSSAVRTVSPWQLAWENGCYYLIAYQDEKAPPVRHYRVDRMAGVLVLDEPRRGKEFFRTFDLPAYLRKHFNMFGGTEYRVTLRCAADLEPVMRERFGREPVFCPEEDGYFHFDVPICVSQQFFGWVCGFGGKVEVTAPAAVRAQLHEMVQSLAEQHE